MLDCLNIATTILLDLRIESLISKRIRFVTLSHLVHYSIFIRLVNKCTTTLSPFRPARSCKKGNKTEATWKSHPKPIRINQLSAAPYGSACSGVCVCLPPFKYFNHDWLIGWLAGDKLFLPTVRGARHPHLIRSRTAARKDRRLGVLFFTHFRATLKALSQSGPSGLSSSELRKIKTFSRERQTVAASVWRVWFSCTLLSYPSVVNASGHVMWLPGKAKARCL